jgi:K(+)-stimulated pyrophosphate-energized sodium pump
MEFLVYLVPLTGLLALGYTYWRTQWILAQPVGDARMQKIASFIARGAMSFLRAEYRVLGVFGVLAMVLLGLLSFGNERSHWLIVVAFALGAVFSALAGYIGMRIATQANVRTAEAAKTGLAKALDVSFAGGAVMGMGVVGLAALGIGVLYILFQALFNPDGQTGHPLQLALEVLTGFSLGAESIALFARVGGGIYTKAADVGADLVGKVEAGIPEDDPRNPAVIADNVGDNVGDVAGMGADLFGSYVSTMIATMVLGAEMVRVSPSQDAFGGLSPVVLPLLIAAAGIIFSIVGSFFVKIKNDQGNPQTALNIGNFTSVVLTAIASYFIITGLLPKEVYIQNVLYSPTDVFITSVVGLVVGILVSLITEYYTSMGRAPVLSIIRQSGTGAATNIIAGLSVGFISTMLPTLVLVGGIIISFEVAGLYGVAMAASSMMATTGMQLAIDAFGPIADNAGGIAEMSELDKSIREKTDVLDAVGNTTAAIGKGFAIASAALTSLALFAAYMSITGITAIDISNPRVLGGLLIGAMIPYVFSAMTMSAVGNAANSMIEEVRRQFRTIPGLLQGKEGVEPDYEKCVEISTRAAIGQMIVPGLIALVTPVVVGFTFSSEPAVLGGLIAGVTVSGVLMAIFQSNAGGAWDNAKKSFEKGVEINGQIYKKGTEPHKAAVTGDTVGDPFKDTSGPSMNILIKLMSIVAVVIAPSLAIKDAPAVSNEVPAAPAMPVMPAMPQGIPQGAPPVEPEVIELPAQTAAPAEAAKPAQKAEAAKTEETKPVEADEKPAE